MSGGLNDAAGEYVTGDPDPFGSTRSCANDGQNACRDGGHIDG